MGAMKSQRPRTTPGRSSLRAKSTGARSGSTRKGPRRAAGRGSVEEALSSVASPKTAGTVGHVQLSGDAVLPRGVALPKTAQDMDMQTARVVEGTFADPTKNVEQIDIRPGSQVADFGSGSGLYALALAEAVGETGQVFAVDVQRDLLTRLQNIAAQKGIENIEVVWGNIEEIEGAHVTDETLDLVLISNTLFQVENKNNVFKEAWRVLKSDGTLVVIDWSESFAGMGPPEDYVVRPAEATLLATDNGFALRRDFNPGEHHYGLIFTKTAIASEDAVAEVSKTEEEQRSDFVAKVIAQELI